MVCVVVVQCFLHWYCGLYELISALCHVIVAFSYIQMGTSHPSALWVRCILTTLHDFKIFRKNGKLKNSGVLAVID